MQRSLAILHLATTWLTSRHIVCRAAQENGARANYVSILTGKTKSQFSPIYNSVVFYLINPKVAVDVPAYQRRLHTKFEKNRAKRFRGISEQTFKFFSWFFFSFFVFSHTWKNRCNSQTCTLIQLKFGTLVERQKAIISINFGENPFNILRVIINLKIGM